MRTKCVVPAVLLMTVVLAILLNVSSGFCYSSTSTCSISTSSSSSATCTLETPLKAEQNESSGVVVPLTSQLLHRTDVYLFWGNGCPHCAKEKPFLEKLEKKYTPYLKVHYMEVWYNRTNAILFQKMARAYGTKPMGVPTTFIGVFDPVVGYGDDSTTGAKIESMVLYCLKNGCPSPLEVLKKYEETGKIAKEQSWNVSVEMNKNASSSAPFSQLKNEFSKVPFLSSLNPETSSLLLITIIIAALDSINPCAFFVLFFLLSMLIYANSRKKMLLIGGVFVFFSGFIYFLFMAAWLNFFLIAGSVSFITKIAGAIAVIMALINIKDFFAFKKGVSLTIPESAKPKLFKRMRQLLRSESTLAMLAGTVVLAISANTYELLCTAGFPMLFTRILTLRELPVLHYYAYLALYNVIYVVPLITIVIVFTLTLGARKLTELQGRVLKLISGMMMLALGLVLLINPNLLTNVLTSVAILFGAICSAVLIAFVSLKLGVVKGQEKENESGKKTGKNKKKKGKTKR